MATFLIRDTGKEARADADRLTILKDGSARLHKQLPNGRWRLVGAARHNEWQWIFVVPEHQLGAAK